MTDLHTRTHRDAMTGDAIARAFGAAGRRLAPEHHSALVNASGRVADRAVTLTVTPRPRMLRHSCFATPTNRLDTLEAGLIHGPPCSHRPPTGAMSTTLSRTDRRRPWLRPERPLVRRGGI